MKRWPASSASPAAPSTTGSPSIPSFAKAIETGRAVADAGIARSLFARAKGYSHEVERKTLYQGEERTVTNTVSYPTDTQACVFWLRNRQRQYWSLKPRRRPRPGTTTRWRRSMRPGRGCAMPAVSDLRGELADTPGFADQLGKFRFDALGYVISAFPWGRPGTALAGESGPEPWQRDILERLGPALEKDLASPDDAVRLAVASGHGIGKSALVAWIVLWAMSTMSGIRGIVTANTEAQLRTKTWPELAKWLALCANRDWFTYTATSLQSARPGHDKTWRVDAITWSENNTKAIAGLHNKGRRAFVVFDEASAIPAAAPSASTSAERSRSATPAPSTSVCGWAGSTSSPRPRGRSRRRRAARRSLPSPSMAPRRSPTARW
jgi:hypothetical protein